MPREIKSPAAVITEHKSFDGKHLIQFNESSHRYKAFFNGETTGKQMVGVTTFTKGGYPTSMGLMSWMKRVTAEAMFTAMTVPGDKGFMPRDGFFPMTKTRRDELIAEAKKADKDVAQEAADIGTICHGFAEFHSAGKIAEANALLDQVRGVDQWALIDSCVSKYLEWAKSNKGTLVMAEAVVGYVCPMHRGTNTVDLECTCFCGKFDRLDEVNGVLRLRDYKTSKDIFSDQFIQLAAYKAAIKTWFNLDVKQLEVLRFGKDDGTFDTMMIDVPKEIDEFQKQALRCRRTYNFKAWTDRDERWAWKGKTNAA